VFVGAPYDDNAGGGDAGAVYMFDSDTGELLRVLLEPTPSGTSRLFGWSLAVDGTRLVVGSVGYGNVGAAYMFDSSTGNLLQTFPNPTPVESDAFGASVSISGDNVLVGAFRDDEAGLNAGAAYLFFASTGTQVRTFFKPAPELNHRFGRSVSTQGPDPSNVCNHLVSAPLEDAGGIDAGEAYAFDAYGSHSKGLLKPIAHRYDNLGGGGQSVSIDNRYAVVGAPDDDVVEIDAGAAYIFHCVSGEPIFTLSRTNPNVGDGFGFVVSIDSGKVVIGVPFDDTSSVDSGATYLYDVASGGLLRTFSNPTPETSDFFGISVALSGDYVLVGANQDNTGAPGAGAAYLFDASAGALLRTFLNPTPGENDLFGDAVSISGNYALISAPQDDLTRGAAYLYDTTTGQLLHTLVNPRAKAGDLFGFSVSTDSYYAVAGARDDDSGAQDAGAAYIFRTSTGELLQSVPNPSPETGDHFGWSVSIEDGYLLVGAPDDDTQAVNAGVVHVYRRVPIIDADVDGNGVINSADISIIKSYMGSQVTACERTEIICHADVDNDLDVDGDDVSRATEEAGLSIPWIDADVDGDGDIDIDDLIGVWSSQFMSPCVPGATWELHMDVDQQCDVDIDDLILVWQRQFTPWPP